MGQDGTTNHKDHKDVKNKVNIKKEIRHMFDYMIVGAGFAGSVLAERLATQRK